jgi:hypothetical protein
MPCQQCNSESIAYISAKCSDLFHMRYEDKVYNGYVIDNIGIGDDSNYVKMKYCLDCGQIQGEFPVKRKPFTGHSGWKKMR